MFGQDEAADIFREENAARTARSGCREITGSSLSVTKEFLLQADYIYPPSLGLC